MGDVVDQRVLNGNLVGVKGKFVDHIAARTAFAFGVRKPVQTGTAQQFENFFVRRGRLLGHARLYPVSRL